MIVRKAAQSPHPHSVKPVYERLNQLVRQLSCGGDAADQKSYIAENLIHNNPAIAIRTHRAPF
jgi:hypothetical protein